MLKNNIHLDDSELLDAVFQKAKETGGIYELEHKIIRPDGTVRVVHDLAHPYFDDDGNLYKYIGTTLDITERKKTEERLATQYAVARVLAGSVTLANAAPRLLQVICENLGWELGELWSIDRGANLLRCAETWHVPSIDANEFIDFCLRTGFAPGVGLPGRVWQSGLPEWIADVTTDANLPRAVMAEKAGLHSAFAFPVMLGSEILGVMAFFVREMRQPDEELLKMLSTIVSQIGQFIERKRAEEALRKAHDELEQRVVERTRKLSEANMKLKELDRLKSLFIASMSHELRTPLNSVIGFSSILVNEWMGPLNEEQKENLSAILRSGKHLLALINDVIDVSKIEAGKIESFVENFDMYELLSEAVTTFTRDIKEKGLDLKVEAIHQQMRADRRRLLQCVLNLVSNAVKFTKKGSVNVAARRVGSLEFGAASSGQQRVYSELRTPNSALDGDFIEISVADTGIGIREEDLPKLYQPFVRLIPVSGAAIPGTGLGLYLTRKLVTQVLKGDIICISRYGEGSVFTIRIPML
jgi:signal transduction histidine kinase